MTEIRSLPVSPRSDFDTCAFIGFNNKGNAALYVCLNTTDTAVAGAFCRIAPDVLKRIGKKKTLSKIVFLPTFNEDGSCPYAEIHDRQTMGDLTEKLSEPSEASRLNMLWNKFHMGQIIVTAVLPIIDASEDTSKRKTGVATKYTVPEITREKVAARLSKVSKIPVEDIYVAKQLMNASDVAKGDGSGKIWLEFNDQARQYFENGTTFRLGKYDEQPTDQLKVDMPFYALFVSARLPITRIIAMDDYNDMINRFMMAFFTAEELKTDRTVADIDPDMAVGGLGLVNPAECARMFAYMVHRVARQKRSEIKSEKRKSVTSFFGVGCPQKESQIIKMKRIVV